MVGWDVVVHQSRVGCRVECHGQGLKGGPLRAGTKGCGIYRAPWVDVRGIGRDWSDTGRINADQLRSVDWFWRIATLFGQWWGGGEVREGDGWWGIVGLVHAGTLEWNPGTGPRVRGFAVPGGH